MQMIVVTIGQNSFQGHQMHINVSNQASGPGSFYRNIWMSVQFRYWSQWSMMKAFQSWVYTCIDVIGHPCQTWKHIRCQLSKLVKWSWHERFLIWLLWNHFQYYFTHNLILSEHIKVFVVKTSERESDRVPPNCVWWFWTLADEKVGCG